MEENSQERLSVIPWIEIRTNKDNEIKGFTEFLKELDSIGSLHFRAKWFPACSTGLELSIVYKVGTWLAATWMSGKVYDYMREYESKFWESLSNLFAANSEDMELQTLSMDYDDATIQFKGLSAGHLSEVGMFFNTLPSHLEWLEKHGVKDIDAITLPIYGDALEQIEKIDEDLATYDNFGSDYFRLWRISYDFDCNQTLYDSVRKKLL